MVRRGVEQWQLVGLITRRSQVRILPPLPPGPAFSRSFPIRRQSISYNLWCPPWRRSSVAEQGTHKPLVAGSNPAAATKFGLRKPKNEGSPSFFRWGNPCRASIAASMLPRTGHELCTSRLPTPGRQGCSPSGGVQDMAGSTVFPVCAPFVSDCPRARDYHPDVPASSPMPIVTGKDGSAARSSATRCCSITAARKACRAEANTATA